MHKVTLTYDESIVRQAVLGFWWRVIGLRFLIALGSVAIGLGALLSRGDDSWIVGALASVLALGVTFAVALYVIHLRNSMQKFRALGNAQAVLKASPTELSISSAAGAATLPWGSVVEVWQLKTCWLLLFSKAQFTTLPLIGMNAEVQAFILERVRSSGGKVC